MIPSVNNKADKLVSLSNRLIAAGDYRHARELASKAMETDDLKSETRVLAERILKITGTDPVAAAAILLTLGVMIFLVAQYAF